MKAWVLQGIGKLLMKEVPIPELAADDVLIKVKACGICGSDLNIVYKKGTYGFPKIPGHECAGVIVNKGENVSDSMLGKRVVVIPLVPCGDCTICRSGQYNQCDNYSFIGTRSNGAYAEYIAVPQTNVRIIEGQVSFDTAALAEPAAVALHAVKTSGLSAGDTAVIIGAGSIGILTALWAEIFGCRKVILADIADVKLPFAAQMGFVNTVNSRNTNLEKYVKEQTQYGADVVFETSASEAGNISALMAARRRGTVLLAGIANKNLNISPEIYNLILRKELTIKGTWNSDLSQFPKDEWSMVVETLEKKEEHFNKIISDKISLDEVGTSINNMVSGNLYRGKTMIIV